MRKQGRSGRFLVKQVFPTTRTDVSPFEECFAEANCEQIWAQIRNRLILEFNLAQEIETYIISNVMNQE